MATNGKDTQAITAKDPHYPFPEEQAIVTPMSLLQLALTQNADIDKLEKLMGLQFKWEAKEAEKAFVKAMAEFKANPPEILKNKVVTFGQTAYSHATLDNVCKALTHGLSEHGISHRWTIVQTDGLIRVTCILTHIMGHSEETTLTAGPDQSGSKNAIQAIGSAVTYLQRYTLLAATGSAAANTDNDAASEPAMENLSLHVDRIKEAKDLAVLQKAFTEAYGEAKKIGNKQAMKRLITAKDEKKELLSKAGA